MIPITTVGTSAMTTSIFDALRSLSEFNPDSSCGEWYKEAIKTISDAKNKPNGQVNCAALSTVVAGSGTNNSDKCRETLSSCGIWGALSYQDVFTRFAQKVASDCVKIQQEAKNKKNSRR
jgi:hypothetical protein